MSNFSVGILYVILIYAILLTPVVALQVAARWLILDKAGDKGWKALIPFYGKYTLFKLVWDKNVYWFSLIFSLLFCATVLLLRNPAALINLPVWLTLCIVTCAVCMIFSIFLQIHLAKAFQLNGGFAVGLIFVNTVFMCILGFGRAKYIGIQPLKTNH